MKWERERDQDRDRLLEKEETRESLTERKGERA